MVEDVEEFDVKNMSRRGKKFGFVTGKTLRKPGEHGFNERNRLGGDMWKI